MEVITKSSGSDTSLSNYKLFNKTFNQKTIDFISGLSFDGYILAGNSIANVYEGIPLQGDLDFWVERRDKYMNAFKEMVGYYSKFNLYPSMVEMYNEEDENKNDNNNNESIPRINLIFTKLSLSRLIERFDLPYCRCYWTPNTGIVCTISAQNTIKTKLIIKDINPSSYTGEINYKRILKAIKYGYTFTTEFWHKHNHLIANQKKKFIINHVLSKYTK